MLLNPFEDDPKPETKYWRCRVANLEWFICELLIKNERLRSDLLKTDSEAIKTQLAALQDEPSL